MQSPIEVIINASSGSENKISIKEQVKEAFRANNLDARISLAKSGEDISELAKRAAKSEVQIIVAGGGDGTVSAVAAEIIGTGKTLGVLPLGTLNHFAKDLQISLDIEEAVRVISENYTQKVDVGEINGRIFINNSSIGLYPNIVRQREQHQKSGYGKWFALARATIETLRRYRSLHVKLKIESKEIVRRSPFVFVGNNEYEMEIFNVGSRKCLDAGKLSLYLLHRTGKFGLLSLGLRTLFGRLRQAKDFEAFCVEEIKIETRRKRLLVAFDGEVEKINAPLCYRIRPQALRVIVPKESEK